MDIVGEGINVAKIDSEIFTDYHKKSGKITRSLNIVMGVTTLIHRRGLGSGPMTVVGIRLKHREL